MSARKLPVRLSPEAWDDLEDIAAYSLTAWGAEQCDRFMARLDLALQRLGDNPLLGRPRNELRPGYRSLLTGQHLIWYEVTASEIHIVRLIHSSRDLRSVLEE
jgi:toxin ParE1/3/4